jgi:hypothetical protein
VSSRSNDQALRDARDTVQGRLGLVSLLLWFAFTFGVAYLLLLAVPNLRAPVVLLLGGLGLIVAALPWLAYRRLVEAELRRKQRPRSPQPPFPDTENAGAGKDSGG